MSAVVRAGVGPDRARRPCPGWPARTRGRSGRPSGSRSRRGPSGRPPRPCSASPSMREPSARTWMTRPRMPASAMTRSLPRPSTKCGRSRAAREADERAQLEGVVDVANRSAGPPTRIVVNRASGSSRDVLTPIRRWMSVPIAIGVEAPRSSRATPRETRSISARSGQRPALARRPSRARRPRRRPPGRPSARAAADIASVARRVVEQIPAASTSASASNASSSTRRAAPASTSTRALARWWPAACGYGTTTIGRPSAVTSARVDEPARPTTRSAAASAASISSRRNGYGR